MSYVKKIELIKWVYKNVKKGNQLDCQEKFEFEVAKFVKKDKEWQEERNEFCMFVTGYPTKRTATWELVVKEWVNPITWKTQTYAQFIYDQKELQLKKKLWHEDILELKMFLEFFLWYSSKMPSFCKTFDSNGVKYISYEILWEKSTLKFTFKQSTDWNRIYLSLKEMWGSNKEYKNDISETDIFKLINILWNFINKYIVWEYFPQ